MEGSSMHGSWMFCLESQHFSHQTTRMLKKKKKKKKFTGAASHNKIHPSSFVSCYYGSILVVGNPVTQWMKSC